MDEKVVLVVSHVVEDFKAEEGEGFYDAYLKGFSECKVKVFMAYLVLDSC